MANERILIGAGGTGGHLFPAQELADSLTECECLFVGSGLSTSSFFDREAHRFVEITSHPFKKGFFFPYVKGFWESIRVIREFDPDVVVGFGSYHTFPLLAAAVVLQKKIILFEANAIPGKVNRFFSRFAKVVAYQFPVKKGALVSWLPWGKKREEKIEKEEARAIFGLEKEKKTVLIFGGSQGASFLNETFPYVLGLFKEKIQVIHLTGKEGQNVKEAYVREGVSSYVAPFEKNMRNAYSAADFVICRSGANTIAELIYYELPSLLIPYPTSADDHQVKNGDFLVKAGCAKMVLQKDGYVEKWVKEIHSILEDEKNMTLSIGCLKGEKRKDLSELVREYGKR